MNKFENYEKRTTKRLEEKLPELRDEELPEE